MKKINLIDIEPCDQGPLYARIAQGVVNAIVQGKLGPGDKITPRLTLAKQLGVNSTTVCYAYDQLENQGIIVSKRGSGSYVQPDALDRIRQSAERHYGSITVVIGAARLSECSLERANILMEILESASEELGYPPSLRYIEKLDEQTAAQLPGDGAVFIFEHLFANVPVAQALMARGIPVVSIWSESPVLQNIPKIHYNFRQAASLGCQFLTASGYQRIGYIGAKVNEDGGIVTKFFEFVSRLHDAGLDLRANHLKIVGVNDAGRAYKAALDLVKLTDRPEAVFVDTDAKAIEALHAFQDAGLRVPEDIAIVGYNDMTKSARCIPPLTTVRIPRDIIGRMAAKVLQNWPKDGSIPDQATVCPKPPDGELILRQTTLPPRGKANKTSTSKSLIVT